MRSNEAAFGTILGYHSVAELRDLVTAKDATMRNLARRLGEVSDSGRLDLDTFLPAYNELVARYANARAKAQRAIDDASEAWRPLDMISAENEWNDLLTSLNPRWKDYTWSPGDGSIDDLYDRVAQAGAVGAYDEGIPQPQQGTDVDLNALAATTHVTQALEGAAGTFSKERLILYSVLGGLLAVFVLPRLMLLGMPGGMLLKR
jgi:hypothetical protein